MQSAKRLISVLGVLALCACANSAPVVNDARGPFDTVQGLYGGNEFSALSPEGKRQFDGDKPAANAPPAAPAPVPAPVPAASPGRSDVAKPTVADAGGAPILIAANAFAAVFGGAAEPVKPSAEQLIQLDSLSLVAADAVRVDLQQKLLLCRRAGDACRLAPGAAR